MENNTRKLGYVLIATAGLISVFRHEYENPHTHSDVEQRIANGSIFYTSGVTGQASDSYIVRQ